VFSQATPRRLTEIIYEIYLSTLLVVDSHSLRRGIYALLECCPGDSFNERRSELLNAFSRYAIPHPDTSSTRSLEYHIGEEQYGGKVVELSTGGLATATSISDRFGVSITLGHMNVGHSDTLISASDCFTRRGVSPSHPGVPIPNPSDHPVPSFIRCLGTPDADLSVSSLSFIIPSGVARVIDPEITHNLPIVARVGLASYDLGYERTYQESRYTTLYKVVGTTTSGKGVGYSDVVRYTSVVGTNPSNYLQSIVVVFNDRVRQTMTLRTAAMLDLCFKSNVLPLFTLTGHVASENVMFGMALYPHLRLTTLDVDQFGLLKAGLYHMRDYFSDYVIVTQQVCLSRMVPSALATVICRYLPTNEYAESRVTTPIKMLSPRSGTPHEAAFTLMSAGAFASASSITRASHRYQHLTSKTKSLIQNFKSFV